MTLLLRASLLALSLCEACWPPLKGLKISIPFKDSSEVVLFSLYILSLGDGLRSVEEPGDHTLFHVAWVVKGEVQISVCVGGLSVDAV